MAALCKKATFGPVEEAQAGGPGAESADTPERSKENKATARALKH